MKRKILDPNAKKALNELKLEISREIGLNDVKIENGAELTSRANGTFGGNIGGKMTKRLIEMAEGELINRNVVKAEK